MRRDRRSSPTAHEPHTNGPHAPHTEPAWAVTFQNLDVRPVEVTVITVRAATRKHALIRALRDPDAPDDVRQVYVLEANARQAAEA